MGLLMSLVAELYRRNRDKAAAYDREATLRQSREALRRQVELIDPVRAEVIAREMQCSSARARRARAQRRRRQRAKCCGACPTAAGATVAGVGLLVWWVGCSAGRAQERAAGAAAMKANTAALLPVGRGGAGPARPAARATGLCGHSRARWRR